jgi:hypothetical protein
MTMARSTLRALRLLHATDREFVALQQSVAAAPAADWIAPIRYLRAYHPVRAESLLAYLRTHASASAQTNLATGEEARLMIAQGRTATVDSAMRAGVYDPAFVATLNRALVSAGLAGLAERAAERRAVAALLAEVPLDSALAYFASRPVWLNLWLVGAHHAQKGDTAIARRAHRLIGSLPAGGSPAKYREALQADLESRLAARVNDRMRALAAARRAYELWSIHTEIQHEFMPEPNIRFNLGLQLALAGDTAAAEPIFRSLVPPTSWFGFYTARAWFELGEIAIARGNREAAQINYSMALRYWSRGGREIAAWRERTQRQLALVGERAPK